MAVVESQGGLSLGDELIAFSLDDSNGNKVSSADFSSKRVLLVTFTCNHCPYAKASWPIFIDLQERYQSQGFQIVAINPNNNPAYPDDRFDEMKPYVAEWGINFPYLFDADQNVARTYGAVCTPDNYLFVDGKLVYRGRVNDNWQNPSAVTEKSLELFVRSAVGEDVDVPASTHPSVGCSIKWVNP